MCLSALMGSKREGVCMMGAWLEPPDKRKMHSLQNMAPRWLLPPVGKSRQQGDGTRGGLAPCSGK